MLQQKIRNYGGEAAVREDNKTSRSKTSSPKLKDETKRSRSLYNQNLAWWRKMNKNKPIPTSQITNLSSSLNYDPKRDNRRKVMELDGSTVSFDFNKVTAKRKTGKLAGNDKAQLTAEHLSNSPAPLITPQQHGEFVKVELSSESSVYVLYASANSECPLLKHIHECCYSGPAKRLDDSLDGLPDTAWEQDHHAGGGYASFGIGFMDKRQTGPFFLKNHQYEQAKDITSSLSSIMGRVAAALLNYTPHVFRENEEIKSLNARFCFPPLDWQGPVGWMANQIVIRRIGKGCKHNRKTEDGVVALHADGGDYSTKHPLVYIPRGGADGRGGIIANSRLIIAESSKGGKYIEIETNVRDTICIVVFNSNQNLHGLVQSCPDDESEDAWSTRIIPFITNHIYHYFMSKNKSAIPIDRYNTCKS